MDKLAEKALKAIMEHELIRPGHKVLVGVSGGADSVALLCVLHSLRESLGFSLCAAHLNHCIRGGEADGDEAYVRELCRELGVELAVKRADVPAIARVEGKSLEQAAREQRYAFFEEVMGRSGRVAVAHHMEDQAESVLLHLIRGSGTGGLVGMKFSRDRVIRPFLAIHRQEIEDYLREKRIPFRTDRTNLERDASRNRIRLDIIPYIQQHLNPAFVDAVCSASELIAADEEYLAAQAEKELDAAVTDRGYDRRALLALPWAIRSRALRLALKRAGATSDVERQHIELLEGLMKGRTGASLDLPRICAWISNESICFGCRPEKAEPFQAEFVREGRTDFPGGYFFSERAEGDIIRDNNIGWMDMDKLPDELTVRPRRPGDRFRPLGSGGKKLKDFFIDRKAPRESRETPILFSGSEAVFIPGFGISDNVKVTAGTLRILKVTYHITK